MDSVPGVEECCGLTYIIKSVVVTSHANVFIWHQTVPTFPCDRLISSKISHPPEGKEILRDILLHTHRCRKETGNHWGHICVEIQSLRRLTHKFLTTGVRQLHSFRGQQQCNEHRTESLGIEKPHPSLSCLRHLWYFSWLVFSNLLELVETTTKWKNRTWEEERNQKENACVHNSKVETAIPTPDYTIWIRKWSRCFIADTRVQESRKGGRKTNDRLKALFLRRGERWWQLVGWARKHGWETGQDSFRKSNLNMWFVDRRQHIWLCALLQALGSTSI